MGGESKELSLEYLLCDVSCRGWGCGWLSKPGPSLMSVLRWKKYVKLILTSAIVVVLGLCSCTQAFSS